jgi:hypothetical protein
MNKVTTTLGEVPETDLQYEAKEVENSGNMVVVAREWTYKGSDPQHAAHVDTVVRRDVWATIKCGQVAQAMSEG